MMGKIELMRVYAIPTPPPEGCFLVDRLWPRGVSKAQLQGVQWLKNVAPSTELRQWFHQNPSLWSEFEDKYRRELNAEPTLWRALAQMLAQGKTLTLLFGSKDTVHNQAVVLKDFLLEQAKKQSV
jgi:uncharacterized protein YeaO (DUF488 family)